MRISVVIPTRDRPESLRRCLGALARQDVDELDVVVVDDGSRDRAAVEAAIAAAVPAARLVRSPGRGPATARNVGVRAAEADVVCFTDDDCEPEPAWARLLADAASGETAAGGRTVPPPGARASVVASQAITDHLLRESLDDGGRLRFAPSCNMAAPRELLLKLPFDARYPDAAGEDREWWDAAVAAGIVGRYLPDAVVVHRQHLSLSGFLRQQYRYGRGAARFRASRTRGERPLARPGFYAGLVRRGFAQGPGTGAMIAVAQAATAAGVATERLARARN